tara:strand:- start:14 stop:244 length:231 start_codon:yes stop_codon:yes gene_type:complete
MLKVISISLFLFAANSWAESVEQLKVKAERVIQLLSTIWASCSITAKVLFKVTKRLTRGGTLLLLMGTKTHQKIVP